MKHRLLYISNQINGLAFTDLHFTHGQVVEKSFRAPEKVQVCFKLMFVGSAVSLCRAFTSGG